VVRSAAGVVAARRTGLAATQRLRPPRADDRRSPRPRRPPRGARRGGARSSARAPRPPSRGDRLLGGDARSARAAVRPPRRAGGRRPISDAENAATWALVGLSL